MSKLLKLSILSLLMLAFCSLSEKSFAGGGTPATPLSFTAFTGGPVTYCVGDAAANLSVSYDYCGTTKVNVDVVWYYNTTNSTNPGTATEVSRTTLSSKAIETVPYAPSTAAAGDFYYFVQLEWADTPCGPTSPMNTGTTQFVRVNSPPAPTAAAGTPQNIGVDNTTFEGNAATTGTGTWTYISGPGGTITSPNDPVSTVTALGVGATTFRWTIANSPCTDTWDEVIINYTVAAPPTITLDATNDDICQGTTSGSLAFSSTTDNPDLFSITYSAGAIAQGFNNVVDAALNAPPSTVPLVIPTGPDPAPGVYDADLTVKNNGSGLSSGNYPITITIAAPPAPTAAAGNDQSIGVDNTTFEGNTATSGTGTWTYISGPGGSITSPNNPVSTVTALGIGATTFRWTIANAPCTDTWDEVIINYNLPPTISLDNINDNTCEGTASTANFAYSGTTESPDLYSVDYSIAAEGAGFTDIVDAALLASPIGLNVGAGIAAGVYNANLTVKNSGTGLSSTPAEAITITVNGSPAPVAAAGNHQSIGVDNTTFEGNAPTTGTGTWSKISGAGNITSPNDPVSTVTALGPCDNTFRWTISNPPCTDTWDEVIITVGVNPTITLGANPAVCSGTTTANLTYSATTDSPDLYSIDYDATAETQGFADVVDAALAASPIVLTVPGAASPSIYNGNLTVKNSCTGLVSGIYAIQVTVSEDPTVAAAGNAQNIAVDNTAFEGNTPAVGSGTWTRIVGSGTITTPGDPTSTVTGLGGGANTFRWTISNPPCVDSQDDVIITVTIPVPPTITLDATATTECEGTAASSLPFSATTETPDQFSIDYDATAEAQGFIDVVNAALNAPPSTVPLVIPTGPNPAPGIYNANLSVRNSGSGLSSGNYAITIEVIGNPAPTAAAGTDQGILVDNTTFEGNTPTSGTGTWTYISGPGGSITSPNNPVSTVTALGLGATTFRWTIANAPCTDTWDEVVITYTAAPPPTITLDATNATECQGITASTIAYSATTNSPDQFSIDYDAAAETAGFIDVVNQALNAPPSTIPIVIDGATAGGTYNANLTVRNSGSGVSSGNYAITVSVDEIPIAPTSVTGPASVVPNTGGYVYTSNVVTYATTYTWTTPGGAWTIDGGQGTLSLTVTSGDDVDDGNISVQASNSCGTSAFFDYAVTVDPPSSHEAYTCNGCHVFHNAPGAQLGMAGGNALLCKSCHVSPSGTASTLPFTDAIKAIPGTSGKSHSWDKPAVNARYETNLPTVIDFMVDRVPGDSIMCSTCHDGHDELQPPYLGASNAGDALCKDCHSARDVGPYPAGIGSHPVGVVYNGAASGYLATPTAPVELIGGKVECSSCHGVHDIRTPSTENLTNDGYLLRVANDVNLCLSCHDLTHPIHSGTGCLDCHQVHNSPNQNNNLYLIRDTISNATIGDREVIFTALTGANSFADGDGVYDGICEVCHDPSLTPNTYFLNDGSGSDQNHNAQGGPQNTKNCTSCHSHNEGFSGGSCISCHSSSQGGHPPITGGSGEFSQESSHTAAVPVVTDCQACHYEEGALHKDLTVDLKNFDTGLQFSGDLDVYCVKCHDATPPGNMPAQAKYNKINYVGTVHDTYATNSCVQCHNDHGSPYDSLLLQSTNYLVCRSCHDGVSSSIDIDEANIAAPGSSGNSHGWYVNASDGLYESNTPSDPTMSGKLLSNDTIVCTTCHDPHDNTNTKFTVIANNADQMCKDCHTARDVLRYSDAPSGKGSHPVGVVYTAGGNYADPAPTLGTASVGLIGGKIECRSCHSVHNATTADGYLLRQTNDNTLCMSCHNYTAHNGFGCKDCHDTHNADKTNIYMLANTVNGNTVSFLAETGANSFADGDASLNGICEACHTTAVHHTTGGDGHNHQDQSNCTTCHTHASSFAAQTCSDCHSDPPSGTALQIFDPGGQFDGASTHNGGTAPANSDCESCHWPENGTESHMNTAAVAILKDPDANAAWTGDKDVWCIRCHDATPPADMPGGAEYNKSAYTGTVHDTYATNSCQSCHNPHESGNTKLLTQNTNYLVCRTCHDGVESTIDINIADKAIPGTSGTSHAWDIASGSFETNDPTTSPMDVRLDAGKVMCNTCHDPHNNTNGKFLVNDNTADAMCKDCHSARDKGIYTAAPASNKGTHPVGITYNGGDSRFNAAPTSTVLINSKVECRSCHMVHNSTSNDGYLLRMNNDAGLCTDCHTYGSHNGNDCLACHDVHNPSKANIYMIANLVNGNAVNFTAETGANSFADGDATLEGICEACHTTAVHHTTTGDGHNHQDQSNCTTCHSHANNFAAQTCSDCHSDPPYGTALQIFDPGGQFDGTSTHNGGAAPGNSDCEACHWPENGTESHMNTAAVAILKDPDANAANTLDKDVWCVKCHDASPPLDMPAGDEYNKSAYTGTVHDSYATNSCQSCHNPHESGNAKLLTQNTNYLVCRTCHDGVESTIDIDANDIFPSGNSNTHPWNVLSNSGNNESNTPTKDTLLARVDGSNMIQCSTCHDPHDNSFTKFQSIHNPADEMCKNCHAVRDIQRYQDNVANKGSHPVNTVYSGTGSVKATPTGSVVTVNSKVECTSCHDPHNSGSTDGNLLRQTNDDALCTDCHTYSTHQLNGCNACHDPHNTDKTNIMMIGSLATFTARTGANSFADGDASYTAICETCHSSKSYFVDANRAIPGTSGSSHNWDVNLLNATYESDNTIDAELQARVYSGKITCVTCHDQHSDANPSSIRKHTTVDALCKDCHTARDVGVYPAKGSHPVGVTLNVVAGEMKNPTTLSLVGGKVECTTCHGAHDVAGGVLTTDGYLLKMPNNSNLCKDCHLLGSTEGTPAGTHNTMVCMDCHQVHNNDKNNIYLIKSHITKTSPTSPFPLIDADVNFTALTNAGSFVGDGTAPFDGICEVCHISNSKTFHYNNSGGDHSHEINNNCTSCHTHATNFKKPSCHGCHDGTPGAYEWPQAPDYNEGSHAVHLSPPYEYKCNECHFGQTDASPEHNMGSVDIVFDPTGIGTTNGENPTWNSVGKTCNNVYCHSDSRGAYVITPAWGGTINNCTTCHGVEISLTPAYVHPGTGAHTKHVDTKGYACSNCHYGLDNTVATHANGTRNVVFDLTGASAVNRFGQDDATETNWTYVDPSYDNGTFVCSNLYCHSDGRSAHRGTDGTYIWGSGSSPSQPPTYTNPAWTGSIVDCISCHKGTGDLSGNKISRPGYTWDTSNWPGVGHSKNAHDGNSQGLSGVPDKNTEWAQVHCFWCHTDPSITDVGINPQYQGSYGTSFHLDGQTLFKPLRISQGGTMIEEIGVSHDQSGHCASGQSCFD